MLEAQIIDDLLDLTRISSGKIELRCEFADVHAAIADAVEILAHDVRAKGLVLTTDLGPEEHWTWADPTRLRQVFWNLLNNAVKFTPEGGRIEVRTSDAEVGQLAVSFTDTGIGVEPERAAHIFEAFEQGERTVTRQFGGLGLGLAISRNLIEMHGGAIAVESAGRGKGSTFTVRLPRMPGRLMEAQTGPPAANSSARRLRILLVDDHDDTRRILARLLARLGHDVQLAQDVKTALAMIESAVPEVIISDIGLPDGSGLDLMTAVRKGHPEVHGIALSGFGMDEDRRRSQDAGFEHHLIKPLDFEMLEKILATTVPRGR